MLSSIETVLPTRPTETVLTATRCRTRRRLAPSMPTIMVVMALSTPLVREPRCLSQLALSSVDAQPAPTLRKARREAQIGTMHNMSGLTVWRIRPPSLQRRSCFSFVPKGSRYGLNSYYNLFAFRLNTFTYMCLLFFNLLVLCNTNTCQHPQGFPSP